MHGYVFLGGREEILRYEVALTIHVLEDGTFIRIDDIPRPRLRVLVNVCRRMY